jgi:hypothetical protein
MGDLRHCTGKGKSSLYTSSVNSTTYRIRNLVGHTAYLDALRKKINFPCHELSSDSSVVQIVDRECTNPSSRVAMATGYCAVAPNNFESSVCNVLRFTLPVVFWGASYIFGKYVRLHLIRCIFLITISMMIKLTAKCTRSSSKHTHTRRFVAFPL